MSLFDTLHSDRNSQLGNGRKVGRCAETQLLTKERNKNKQRKETKIVCDKERHR
jgi:hypothetical protein